VDILVFCLFLSIGTYFVLGQQTSGTLPVLISAYLSAHTLHCR